MRISRRVHLHLSAVLLATLLAACASPIGAPASAPKPGFSQAPKEFPTSFYEQAAARGQPVYRVEPVNSLVAVTVRRAGSMARLGHDHVIASRAVQGYIAPEAGRADLFVPLAELTVDEPALRAEAGLDTQPTESDIAGTRSNMLDKVLDVQQFPFALIRVNKSGQSPAASQVAVTLHGTTRTFSVPTQVEATGDKMRVTGSLEFNQSDFGILPFSILGGAIQVKDELSLRFAISAIRGGHQDASSPRENLITKAREAVLQRTADVRSFSPADH
jgi:polyisoprenoid-binding protein YceI